MSILECNMIVHLMHKTINEWGEPTTTLKNVLSDTYYLESDNAITIYCISHIFPSKGQISRGEVMEH